MSARQFLQCDACMVEMAIGATFGMGESHAGMAGDYRDENCSGRIRRRVEPIPDRERDAQPARIGGEAL